jgi:hypothetical protein
MSTDDPKEPVVVHGVVVQVVDASEIDRFTSWVNEKYETEIPVSFFADNACLRLEPLRAFGLDESNFTGTPTRWLFQHQSQSRSQMRK